MITQISSTLLPKIRQRYYPNPRHILTDFKVILDSRARTHMINDIAHFATDTSRVTTQMHTGFEWLMANQFMFWVSASFPETLRTISSRLILSTKKNSQRTSLKCSKSFSTKRQSNQLVHSMSKRLRASIQHSALSVSRTLLLQFKSNHESALHLWPSKRRTYKMIYRCLGLKTILSVK